MNMNYFNPFFTVKVMDGLFISNHTAVKDQQFIMNNKFSLIVNTCPRQFKVLPVQNVYKVINFHWVNSKNQLIESINLNNFKPIFQEITSNLQEGYGNLIVSQRGHSRAITFVLLYLMDKFKWQLFKSLQYINSKRQNLSVRATYLKLLVNYEKTIKGESLQNSKMIQNEDIPNHIKSSSSKQKWSQQNITCDYQKLITNTFKNTIKKRNINEINLEYREKINKILESDKRLSINNTRDKSRENMNKNRENMNKNRENMNKKSGKSVQFSNEIEIIIGESQTTHNFPQYQQLKLSSSSQIDNKRVQSNNRSNTFSHRQQKPPLIHNLNKELTTNRSSSLRTSQIIQQQQQQQSSSSLSLSKKQYSNNSRLMNVRRIEQKSVKQQSKQINNKNNIIQLHHNQIYDNQFYEIKNNQNLNQTKQNNNTDHQQNNTHGQLLFQQNQSLHLNEFIKHSKQQKLNNKDKYNINNQQISLQKNNQYNLSKKTRLSSYKKLKASILQNQFKFHHSPIKNQQKHQRLQNQPKNQRLQNQQKHQRLQNQQKHQRVQTQPKYDLQIVNFSNQSKLKKPIDRRLSSTQNQNLRIKFKGDHSQHRKSLSSAIEMKTMRRIDKISSSVGKQKRCETPQMGVSQSLLINNQSLSNHNNTVGRPLSKGKSNSVRVTKKTSSSPSAQNKQPTNIFNVNINVNIGKLQMFGNMNNGQQLITKVGVDKQKLFKNLSQIDKMGLIHSRPRSNSSNDNYSKSFVSGSYLNNDNHTNKDTQRSRFIQKSNNKNTHEKVYQNKNFVNKNLSTFNSSAYSMDQLNIGSCESFSKQQIMNKINKKLIHYNKSNNQQLHKNHTIKQNNFM